MSLSYSVLTTKCETQAAVPGAVITTASITTTTGALLVVLGTSDTANGARSAAPTISNTGSGVGTWTHNVDSHFLNNWDVQAQIFSAQVTTGGSITIALDFKEVGTNDAGAGQAIVVYQFTGFNTTTPIKQTFQDGNTTLSATLSPYTGNFASAPASTSYKLACACIDSFTGSSSDIAGGTGWTVDYHPTLASNGYNGLHESITGTTSTAVTFNTITSDAIPGIAWAVAAVEVQAAAGGATQTITGVKFTNTSTFGVAKINMNIAGVKFTNSQSFGAAKLNMNIAGVKWSNTSTFGNNVVKNMLQIVTGVKFTNTSTFGTDTVASTYPITGVKYAETNTFGVATLLATYTIVGTKFSNSQSFGHATLSTTYGITGVKFTNSQTFGNAHIAGLAIQGVKFTNSQSFGAATVTLGPAPQGITGVKFTNSQSFGAATIASVARINAVNYTNQSMFGTAVVTGGTTIVTGTIVPEIRVRRR